MKHTMRALIALLVAALLLSVMQPVLAQEAAPEIQPQTARDDAPTYGVRGPYAVGVRDFVIEPAEEGGRPISVSVWYPALNPDGLPEEVTYMLDFEDPNFPNFPVAGRALRDAEPDLSDGPYPLVVYSHGYWLFRQVSAFLMEQLASYGFVVIAGDHTDNWSTLFGDTQVEDYVIRPQEVADKIDFAETLSDADGEFPGLIDMEHVGVTGHSFGADTALLAGGARLNTDVFVDEWCAMHPGDPEDALNDCVAMPAFVDKMASMAGLDAVPEGVWPDWGDPRVDAIVPLAPGAQYFGKEGLAAVQVPIMLFESELDWAQGIASAYYEPYSVLPAGMKTHVVFDRGDHGVFLNECKAMPALIGMGFSWFCQDSVWDMARAHDLINHFVTAFMLAELKGDAEAAAALAPEAVSFPGITYESERYATEQTTITPELIAEIEAFVTKEMEERQIPGAALGIVKDGVLAYAKGFGVSELGGDDPVTPESIFRVASVSKSFTGVGIMQLVAEGKIDLDAPVTEYLPYFTLAEPESRGMTIRQLLSHTSGMPDAADKYAELVSPDTPRGEDALEEYIRSYSDASLLFQPGEGWAYSTVGIDVLGDVIAKVSGQSFEEYMDENILGPIGMEDSTFLLSEVDPDKLVTPHRLGTEGATTMDYIQWLRVHGPGSGLLTTVNDMARFAIANMNHGEIDGTQVLPATAYEEMWAPQAASTWVDWLGTRFNHYGLGWWVGEDGGYQAIGNYGAVDGFNAHLEILPEKDVAVVFLANFMDFNDLTFNANEIGSAIAVMLGDAESEASTTPAIDPALIAEIEALIDETMTENQIPGFAIGIVKDGEPVYTEGFGVAELGSDKPVTPQSLFHVASTGKTVVAMAILQLVEQGLIGLDDPVTDYLPYFSMADEAYRDITIRHLLAHRAGLPNKAGDAIILFQTTEPRYDDAALEEYVRSMSEFSLLFAPGEDYSYSSPGFDVLGDVIAKVSGQSFEEYMEEHIFAPLGMEDSTFLLKEADPELLTTPHMYDEDGNAETIDFYPYDRRSAPSDGLYTSAADLSRMAMAHLNRGELDGVQVISASAYDEMWTPVSETGWAEWFGPTWTSYGLGWLMGEDGGHMVYNHTGADSGYQAHMLVVPDEDLAIVAMVNIFDRDEGSFHAYAVADEAMKILLGMESEEAAAPVDLGLAVIAMGNGAGGGAIYSPYTATDVMGMLINN